ncbi:MAG: hypothetical protein ACR2N7_02480 [Acidimicrobiia bacterium]
MATHEGWSGLSLWRKGVYFFVALFLGLVFAAPVFALLAAIFPPLSLLGLVAAGFFTWRTYLYVRADIDYVDSPEWTKRNSMFGDGSRHWP